MYHTMTGATVAMPTVLDQQQQIGMQVAMAPNTVTPTAGNVANMNDIVTKTDVSQVEVVTVEQNNSS